MLAIQAAGIALILLGGFLLLSGRNSAESNVQMLGVTVKAPAAVLVLSLGVAVLLFPFSPFWPGAPSLPVAFETGSTSPSPMSSQSLPEPTVSSPTLPSSPSSTPPSSVASEPPSTADLRDWMAFGSSRDGNSDIYRIAPDGQGLTRLTSALEADSGPAWSPDHSMIAFASRRSGTGLPRGFAQVWLMNADGSNQHPLTAVAANSAHPSWSPDGTRIAFDSDRGGITTQIYVVNVDGSRLQQLTQMEGASSSPAWSPRGQIAFVARIDNGFQIWETGADGSATHRLVPGWAAYPAWSADGTRLAYGATGDGGVMQVFVTAADGSSPRAITREPERADSPSWSADGRRIVYRALERSRSQLFTLDLVSGSSTRLLDDQFEDTTPSWR